MNYLDFLEGRRSLPSRNRITLAAWRGVVAGPGLYSSPGAAALSREELIGGPYLAILLFA